MRESEEEDKYYETLDDFRRNRESVRPKNESQRQTEDEENI
jgi:hypothetical protein